MRVALFGGSFNPPHVAHQLAALYVLETQAVDELWFVPCFKHPFDKALAPFEDRFAMCKLAAAALGARARASDIEQRLGGESRTLRTVKVLRDSHPHTAFALVVGGDLVPELDTWYGADELVRLAPYIVVSRGGHGAAAGLPMPALSSTEVRERIARGADVSALLPRTVVDYIRQRKLYGWQE
jgi:nicotinate-nucleotide adenylyltransferase